MRARVLAAVVLLVAVGGGPKAHAAEDDARILHVLRRVTYGPRPGDVERIRAMGLAAYLEQQLAPSGIDDRATDALLATLPTLRMSIPELLQAYPRPDARSREKVHTGEMSRRDLMEMYPPEKRPARIVGELQAAKAVRAVMSERQLQEVMTDFWFNHFNVYAAKGEGRWYVGPYERDVIRSRALGRFPDLLRATAHHPAMLFYLDNWLSARPDFVIPTGPQRGRRAGLNENYARELMELHTLGVDGGYTQQDVTEVARAFTGWTIDQPRQGGGFRFDPRRHVLGIDPCLPARVPMMPMLEQVAHLHGRRGDPPTYSDERRAMWPRIGPPERLPTPARWLRMSPHGRVRLDRGIFEAPSGSRRPRAHIDSCPQYFSISRLRGGNRARLLDLGGNPRKHFLRLVPSKGHGCPYCFAVASLSLRTRRVV